MRIALSVRIGIACCGLVLGILPLASPAVELSPGHQLNSWGRWIGYGWSRGYHAQDGCQTEQWQSYTLSQPAEQHALPAPSPVIRPQARPQPAPSRPAVLAPAEINPATKPYEPKPAPAPKSNKAKLDKPKALSSYLESLPARETR